MTRAALGRVIGGTTAVAMVLVALAGSDWPPPRGFVAVIAVAGLLGILTALLVPPMLDLADRAGTRRAVLAAMVAGAALGVAVGLGFAAAGPGEPSTPSPGIGQLATFVVVVSLAGTVGAALVAGVAIAVERLRRSGPSRGAG